MRPESVKEYENSGSHLDELFPVGHWEYLVAEVNSLGVHTGNGFVDSSFPPSPGTRVTEPDGHILSDLFGLDPYGLHIGQIPHHDVEVSLNTTRLLQKHLAILAISGASKSLKEWDKKHWEMMSDSASLVIASGRNAVIALAGRGVGRKAAGRILAKMHTGDELLKDILHAEQTYARNRRFWKG